MTHPAKLQALWDACSSYIQSQNISCPETIYQTDRVSETSLVFIEEVAKIVGFDQSEGPVRLCCGQRHAGPVCPDGKVMCCLCFERFDDTDLNRLENGQLEDVCTACAKKEACYGGS